MRRITVQDVTDWTLGTATEEVCRAIDADREQPDSLVQEYLDWLGGEPKRLTPRLVRDDFNSLAPHIRSALANLFFDDRASAAPAVPTLPTQPGAQSMRPGESVIPFPAGTPPSSSVEPDRQDGVFSNLAARQRPESDVTPGGEKPAQQRVSSSLAGLRHAPELALKAILVPASLMAEAIAACLGVFLRRSLLEYLVVLFIISGLIALQLPPVQSAREAARRAQCTNELKQIGIGIAYYETTHGCFPYGSIMNQDANYGSTCPLPPFGYSLFASIVGYEEAVGVYNAINFNVPPGGHDFLGLDAGAINRTAMTTRINSYICPSDSEQKPLPIATSSDGYSQTSYAGNAGTFDIWHWHCGCPPIVSGLSCQGSRQIASDGVFFGNRAITVREITDGLGNTIFVGETSRFGNDPDPQFNSWSRALLFRSSAPNSTRPQALASTVPRINAPFQPNDITNFPPTSMPTGDVNSWLYNSGSADYRQLGQFGFRSQHPGGANFLFGDGSVHFLKETIDMGSPAYNPPQANIGVYRKLSTRNGGETIADDSY